MEASIEKGAVGILQSGVLTRRVHQTYTEDLLKHIAGRGYRVCLSNKFPDDADVIGSEITLCVALL